jgi:hypothetical protein
MICSGLSPDYRLVEMVEIPSHPYFIATQFHPEFQSRPNRAHPLFRGLIAAALEHNGFRAFREASTKAMERPMTSRAELTLDNEENNVGLVENAQTLEL